MSSFSELIFLWFLSFCLDLRVFGEMANSFPFVDYDGGGGGGGGCTGDS